MMALLFLAVGAAAVLKPAQPVPTPASSNVPTASVAPTSTPVDPDRLAIETAIAGFYSTLDAGDPPAESPYVYPEGRGGISPATAGATGTTIFSIARAVIGSSTADVYGRESRSRIASDGIEIEFRLRLVDKEWLISSWQAAREATIPPARLRLTDVTTRDVVATLIQARRVGDAATIRMLTTPAFQRAHSSWLDGIDRSDLLSSWRIVSARPKDDGWEVDAAETWKPTPLDATYRVVLSDGEALVDAWSWK